jgi:hypothetical protein
MVREKGSNKKIKKLGLPVLGQQNLKRVKKKRNEINLVCRAETSSGGYGLGCQGSSRRGGGGSEVAFFPSNFFAK